MPWPLWILGRLQRAIIIQVIMGFQMQICSMFAFLLVDFGEVLCSSANELQETQILTILSEIHRLSFRLWGLLSFVCHS